LLMHTQFACLPAKDTKSYVLFLPVLAAHLNGISCRGSLRAVTAQCGPLSVRIPASSW